MPQTTRNIIIFGETGVGKSSVVNLIIDNDNDKAETSENAEGCTFESTIYTVWIDGVRYHLHDTAGLNECGAGTVDSAKALANLYKLVQSLALAGGVNLLVFVMKHGRLTDTAEKNYNLFYQAFCEGNVPIVIVVTCCEDVEPEMDAWWTWNRGSFEKSNMAFDGHACVCARKGRKMADGTYSNGSLVEESKGRLQQLIHEKCRSSGWKKPPIDWFQQILISLRIFFKFSIPSFFEHLSKPFSPEVVKKVIEAVRTTEKRVS